MRQEIVYTIGHSTRSIGEFVGLLKAHGIELVADVRTVPKSGHNPQFSREALEGELVSSGIDYIHIRELGGLRKPLKNSINTGWKNSSFRGFADYMQTSAFDEGLEKLIDVSKNKRTVIMCAEAIPWRCHRSLIADALIARKIRVMHIIGPNSVKPHEITSFAKIAGKKITYL